MLKKIIILITIIFNSAVVFAMPLKFDGFVSDNANVLTVQAVRQINGLLLDLQRKTETDVAVVTLKTLEGRTVEETALNISREAKLGSINSNNGALILVVPPEHIMRIEIGYGLEGIINDAKAGRIRDEMMIPYFQRNEFEKGITLGTYTLAYEIAKGYGVTLKPAAYVIDSPQQDESYIDLLIILFILLLIFGGPGGFFIFPGGGFGGRGGGIRFGGGGGFGGGGASGRW